MGVITPFTTGVWAHQCRICYRQSFFWKSWRFGAPIISCKLIHLGSADLKVFKIFDQLCGLWRGCQPSIFLRCTPRKFNSSPLKTDNPKRKLIFQPSFFRGYVKFRGCIPNITVLEIAEKTSYMLATNNLKGGYG